MPKNLGLHKLLCSRTARFGSILLATSLALADGLWTWSSRAHDQTHTSKVLSARAVSRLSMQQLYDHLVAGETQPVREKIASLQQELPEDTNHWNYSNVAHQVLTLMGLLALYQDDDLPRAKEYLLLAGQIPGSPQLNSFGPNMLLAKDLLERGEFDTVELYLKHCQSFWERGGTTLEAWIQQVQNHETPNFGANLDY